MSAKKPEKVKERQKRQEMEREKKGAECVARLPESKDGTEPSCEEGASVTA